jgi:RNA polymerase sigma factor (sigma-70 family)
MSIPRYDMPTLMRILAQADADTGLSVMSVHDPRCTNEWAIAPDVVEKWLTRIGCDIVTGGIPDLGVLPDLAVTEETPEDDFRWKVLKRAREDFEELGSLGLAMLGKPPEQTKGRIVAVQVVNDGRLPYVRVNGAVCGIFWGWARPGRLDIGFELLALERDTTTHITVIKGHVEGKPAAFVFWNVDPTIIRVEAKPEAGDAMLRRMDKSLGIPGARQRWQGLRSKISPSDVASAFYETIREGVHPDQRATTILDKVEALANAGLPSRRSKVKVSTDQDFASLPIEAVGFDESRTVERLAVDEALAELSERDQAILRRRYFEDQTDAQIGEALGLSQQRVNKLRLQAEAALKRRLTPSLLPPTRSHLL